MCKNCQGEHRRLRTKRNQERWAHLGDEEIRAKTPFARCPYCGETKPSSEFGISRCSESGLTSHCRECRLERANIVRYNKYYQYTNAKMDERGGCAICGVMLPYPAMSWHHPEGAVKVAPVSTMITRKRPLEEVLAEIEKCDLLCGPCHHLVHTRGWEYINGEWVDTRLLPSDNVTGLLA